MPNDNASILLALDLSSFTGYAIFTDGVLTKSGDYKVDIDGFNVNDHPEKSPKYPKNLIDAVAKVADYMMNNLVTPINPTHVVIENTVKGRNRSTQRFLEWLHYVVYTRLKTYGIKSITYLDPSEWRSILEVRLSKEDKKNNRDVSKKKKRGRITKKHLAVRQANAIFNLNLKMKDNNRADALLLGWAFLKREGT